LTKATNIQFKKFFRQLLIAALILIFSIIGIFSSILVALQYPYIQTKVVQKATSYISNILQYPITIQAVDISWFDIVNLNGIKVMDRENNEMIYLEKASVDFSISSLSAPTLVIDEVTLHDGRVSLYKFQSDSSVNITDFIETIREIAAPRTKSDRTPVPFHIAKVNLDNMYFSYFDQRRGLIETGFDHNHFIFTNINAEVTDLKVIADTFQIQIDGLQAIEKQTQLPVHNANLLLTITRSNMSFENIDARIGKSHLNNYLIFNYADINDLSDFNEKIDIVAVIDSGLIYSKDLGHFAPQIADYHDFVTLTGEFKGKVIDFSGRNISLGFGKNTVLKGRASFKGLPDLNETYIDVKFRNSRLQTSDLKQYSGPISYDILAKFGQISGTGEFVGFPYDFVAQGSFMTNLGKLESDLNFKILENQKPGAQYKGTLTTTNFQLGKFLDVADKVGNIDMSGKLSGKGLTLADAEIVLDAKISKLLVNNYTYKGIDTKAKLSDELFDGFISVKDPNLILTANGLINLKDNANKFDITANFEKANLKQLNITEIETFLKSNITLNFTGLNPDDIVGEAYCSNTYLLYEGNKEIFIDTLFTKSNKHNGSRNFYLNSDILSVNADGDFEFSSLYSDLNKLYKEYELSINNDKNAIAKYYAKLAKQKAIDKYQVDFNVKIKDLNQLFSIYTPGLYLSENTTIDGQFTKGITSTLNCVTYIDTLFYKENEVYQSTLEVNTSKYNDSANILAMVYLKTPKQAFKDFPITENLVMEAIWDIDQINFSTKIKQAHSTNNIKLNGDLSLREDKQQIISFNNSSFSLLDKTWNLGDANKIYLSNEGMDFSDFSVRNLNQLVELNGRISENASKNAMLTISNFQLSTINPLIEGIELDGIANGSLDLRNIINDLNLGGNITVDTLKLDGFLIGNIDGQAAWNQQYKRLDVKVDVERSNEKIIFLDGFVKYNETTKAADLDLIAKLTHANLEILTPILDGIISDIKGNATGTLSVKGTPQNLIINGAADVNSASFKIDYLNTTYFLDDYVYMEDNLIGFKKLKLRDSFGNIAIVDGGIFHDNFRKFVLDIKGYMNSFHILNTTEKDNELFYGTAFASGDIEFLGAFNDFEIKANAKSNKGTKIYIPIQESASIKQQSFIKFASAKKQVVANKDLVDLSGIKMDFNLEITPEAYVEIIFDKRAGDIIRGNGTGNLKMEIDTRGDFFLYGSYFITKGAYNFTLANLINKEFTILPNSSITWFGDPYHGLLDIDAVYRQAASLKPLITSIEDSAKADIDGARKAPVDVLLGLNGNLLKPEIDMGIKILNYPIAVEQYVTGFESLVAQNEQELNRQVFSLLILGGFAPPYSFAGLAADPTSNLSELLTNQLGNWLSQVDENLQIDLDLNGLDREALNTFNLRLSYTLLDGRLRITRDGRLSNVENTNSNTDPNTPNTSSSNNNLSNIAGEWTIEYLISPDGKLRLKLFNKNTQNQVGGFTNTSAGFSLLHTASFNNLRDLISPSSKPELPIPDTNPTDSSSNKPNSHAVPVRQEPNP
jgi:hypothetical protein